MDTANESDQNEMKHLAKNLVTVFRHEEGSTALTSNATVDETPENEESLKNPLRLSPVIRCIFQFLNIKDIKNCRLVCREWGSVGKVALASRATIRFRTYSLDRDAVDFYSCFQSSAALFSAFKISGLVKYFCASEELPNFFEKQQKYIKELTLMFSGFAGSIEMKNIDLSSWISKSPLVQKETKHMTKLKITGHGKFPVIPLHLISNIKDISLEDCRINVEEGIKICPIKLRLDNVTFFQDGIKLDRVLINDIMDFSKTKEVVLLLGKFTKCAVDLKGRITLDKLTLHDCEVLNGGTSQWAIEQLKTIHIPYSLNSQMKIKELHLYRPGTIDLFTLPNSIQKLELPGIGKIATVICSQPIVLENLQYLFASTKSSYSFLSHFMNCPKLTHLNLKGTRQKLELKSLWMPKSVKTLTFQFLPVDWVDDSFLHLENLVCKYWDSVDAAKKLCRAKIRVDDLFISFYWSSNITADADFVDFLEMRNRFNFGKRLYIGKLNCSNEQLENSDLKKNINEKSQFYVFENGKMGRSLSEKDFQELIPKHPDM